MKNIVALVIATASGAMIYLTASGIHDSIIRVAQAVVIAAH